MGQSAKVKVFRSAEEWEELLSGQESSGKPVAVFCRELGIVRTSFEKWRRKLREVKGGGNFQEVPQAILVPVPEHAFWLNHTPRPVQELRPASPGSA